MLIKINSAKNASERKLALSALNKYETENLKAFRGLNIKDHIVNISINDTYIVKIKFKRKKKKIKAIIKIKKAPVKDKS